MENEKSLKHIESMQTPSIINESHVSIDKPKSIQFLMKNNIASSRIKSNGSANLNQSEIIDSNRTNILKGKPTFLLKIIEV